MAIDGGVEVPVHDLDRALSLLAEGAELLLEARTWSRTQDEVRGALSRLTAIASTVEAGRLRLVRASASRDDGSVPGRETQQWMVDALRLPAGRARADIENAELLDPDDGILRELARIPRTLLERHREKVASNLTRNAQRFNSFDLRKVAAHLVSVLAPAREERLDPLAEERRNAACFRDGTGMTQVSARLAGEGGLFFDRSRAARRPWARGHRGRWPGAPSWCSGPTHPGAAHRRRPGADGEVGGFTSRHRHARGRAPAGCRPRHS